MKTSNRYYKAEILKAVENGYAETHIGYHADYQNWRGTEQRGCYVQIAETHGGTKRIYARNWFELYHIVMDMTIDA